MSGKLSSFLETTLALSEQFQAALSPPDNNGSNTTSANSDPNALSLLSASSKALKSQVTKLSLFAINSPFTPPVICAVLSAVNESVLPSLVTAALLITADKYTKGFHTEAQVLTKTTLRDLSSLVESVKAIAAKKSGSSHILTEHDLSATEKDAVTTAAGRVWDSCDVLTDLAGNGVVGFLMRRVEEWRDLVKDAICELEEWDPDEEDESFDDLLGDDDGDESNASKNRNHTSGTEGTLYSGRGDDDSAALLAFKKSTLRVFKPIVQIFPAILSNRLKKNGPTPSSSSSHLLPPSHIEKLESLTRYLQDIPSLVDEAAGSLYEANIASAVIYTKNAKECAAQAVQLTTFPWSVMKDDAAQTPTEDKFTTWSRTWLKVMDEVMKPEEA
ncbi:hypothetical protein V8E54_000218 [Elaphomyces granulatus]|jgi:hypothetical protein